MIGQRSLSGRKVDQAIKDILKKERVAGTGHQAYPSIVARGGGARDIFGWSKG